MNIGDRDADHGKEATEGAAATSTDNGDGNDTGDGDDFKLTLSPESNWGDVVSELFSVTFHGKPCGFEHQTPPEHSDAKRRGQSAANSRNRDSQASAPPAKQ